MLQHRVAGNMGPLHWELLRRLPHELGLLWPRAKRIFFGSLGRSHQTISAVTPLLWGSVGRPREEYEDFAGIRPSPGSYEPWSKLLICGIVSLEWTQQGRGANFRLRTREYPTGSTGTRQPRQARQAGSCAAICRMAGHLDYNSWRRPAMSVSHCPAKHYPG